MLWRELSLVSVSGLPMASEENKKVHAFFIPKLKLLISKKQQNEATFNTRNY